MKMRAWSVLSIGVLLAGATGFIYWFTQRPPHRFQLTMNPPLKPVTSGVISPDGQMVAYSDGGGVHVRELSTNRTQITTFAHGADVPVDWRVSSWFPDNSKLLVNVIAKSGKTSLWVVTSDGRAHFFLDDTFGWSVSPDGSWIAITERKLNTYMDEIWLIDPNGQHRHKPFEISGQNILTQVRWSHDGKWLAYLKLPSDPLDFKASLEIRGLDGSPPIILVSNPRLRDFFWLSDGRIVYSIREESGCVFGSIRINPTTGDPEGKPQRIARLKGACMQDATATSNGHRISYTDGPSSSTVLTVDLDSEGMPANVPKRLTISEGSDSAESWLTDNRTVIFQSSRTGHYEVYRQADANEAPLQLTQGSGDKYWPRATSDGTSILYQVLPHILPRDSTVVTYAEPRPLLRIPVAGGAPQLLVEEPLVLSHRCARQVNLCLMSEMNSTKDQLVFNAIDFTKGKGREVARYPTEANGNYSWDISPDGTQIAIARAGDPQISIFPLTGGTVHQIPVKGWIRHQGFDWAADGQGLIIGTATPGGTALLHVNLQGNVRTVWRQLVGVRCSGIQSPDGKHMTILGWVHQSNLWVMENR